MVIACGGDGTLNEVVNGLADAQNGHRVPLALLPGGTANVLAKELNLPWDIPGAAEKLIHGQIKEIALGLATPLLEPEKRRYFLSVAGAGPDGMIVYCHRSGPEGARRHSGVLVARELAKFFATNFRTFESSRAIKGSTRHWSSWAERNITVARSKSPPNADLYENKFELMALTTQSGFRYLSYLPSLWVDKLRGTDGVHFWKAESIVCEPLDSNPVYAQIDGEPLARLPVEFKIVPDALKLLVPRNGAAQKSLASA